MRSDEGLAVVIGVAGSGKTSVALGRTKMLVDAIPEDANAAPFYRSESAMGFVLNGQLCDYLTKTCQQLALYDMPVQEFHQLRARLLDLRRLDDTGFEHAMNEMAHPLVGTMAWLRSADSIIARTLAARIRDAVRDPPKEVASAKKQVSKRTPEQEAVLLALWADMVKGMEGVTTGLGSISAAARFHLERLASKIDTVRRRFADALEKNPEFTGADRKDLRQNIRNALRERVVRALRLPDAYADVLAPDANDRFTQELLRNLQQEECSEVPVAVAEASARLNKKKLTDADLDVLLSLAHVISVGYRGRDDRDPISHLTEPDWYSQVFIDEFQDFSEVQLFMMGAQANPERRTVTVVGDYLQKLRRGRRISLADAFPWAERSQTVPGVLLENKRQTGRLATLSQRFRAEILGDRPGEIIDFSETGDPVRFIDASGEELQDAIAQEVLRFSRHHSVAVICPSDAVAHELERTLRDRLGTNFRDTKHSKRGDLLQRYYVHFTTPVEAKGLEFDAVVVVKVEDFKLNDSALANGCYVAISRPRMALSIVGEHACLDDRWSQILSSNVVERVELDHAET